MKQYIFVLTLKNVEYRLTNVECRSRARRRPTLQNSTFVNRYSIFFAVKRDSQKKIEYLIAKALYRFL
jgi:hypothetical protein